MFGKNGSYNEQLDHEIPASGAEVPCKRVNGVRLVLQVIQSYANVRNYIRIYRRINCFNCLDLEMAEVEQNSCSAEVKSAKSELRG